MKARCKQYDSDSQSTFFKQILDFMPAHIAVLDEEGTICYINKAWVQFAEDNGYADPDCGLGKNYIDACKTSLSDKIMKETAEALEAMTAGTRATFSIEYPCDSDNEKRWFRLDAITFSHDENNYIIMRHDPIAVPEYRRQLNSLHSEILEILNRYNDWEHIFDDLAKKIKDVIRFDAVGIRLQQEEDYPYYASHGFSESFISAENSLCAKDSRGNVVRDKNAHVVLECMCGTVISGNTDPSKPFFTEAGSFWTNSTTQTLAETSPDDRGGETRNRCNREGYESVAFIPIRARSTIIGLLQLNDKKKDRFNEDFVRLMESVCHSIGIALERKQFQDQLQQSEEQFRLFYMNSPLGYQSLDENGRIQEANPAWFDLLGYQPEEVLGRSFGDFLTPECKELFRQRFPKFKEIGKTRRADFKMQAKDGREIEVEIDGNVAYETGRVFKKTHCVLSDVTERKNAVNELEKRALIIDSSTDAIVTTDVEGKILRCNAAGEKIYGYPLSEFVGQHISIVYPQEELPKLEYIFDRLRQREIIPNLELNIQRKDGSQLPVLLALSPILDANGEILEFMGSARDITRQRKTEQALRQSQERFRLAQHASDTGIWERNLITDEVYWSENVECMFGLAPGGFQDSFEAYASCVIPEDRRRVQQEIEEALQAGTGFRTEYRIKRPDGKIRWMTDIADIFTDDEGNPTRLVGTVHDITEKKEAEQALQASEAAVRNKLKAITEPEGSLDDLNLSDIIDIEALQSLMEDFHAITGMLGAVLDIKGNILVGVGWQDICTKFHRICSETEQHCIESDTLLSQGVKTGQFNAYRCKNNMWDMASPIEVGGRHLGNIYFGQYFYSDEVVDVGTFREQARRYGFDEKQYLEALSRVPRFDRETVNKAMSFYSKLAAIISVSSYSNILLARALSQQKRAETSLRQSEEKFRALFEQSGGYCMILDPNTPDGIPIILDANKAACQAHGYTHDEFIGRPVACIDDEDGKRLCRERTREIMTGEPFHVENIHVRKDGTKFHTAVNAQRIDIGDEPPLIYTVEYDITERKRAKEELEKNLALFSNILDAIPDMVWLKDADGKYLMCNRELAKLVNLENEQVIGKTDYDIFPKEKADAYREKDRAAIQNKTTTVNEESADYLEEGYSTWVETLKTPMYDSQGELIGVLGIARDISRTKQALQEARENEDFLSLVMDRSPFSMWIGSPNGTLLRANEALYNALNLTPDQVVGKYNLLEDENLQQPEIKEKIESVFRQKQPVRFDLPWTPEQAGDVNFSGGRSLYIDVSIFPLLNYERQITHIIVQWVDITARKEAEKQLAMINKAIENSLNAFDIIDQDGTFIYVNKSYVDMWGYDSAEEIIGTSPVSHCADPEIPIKIIAELKEKGRSILEFQAKRKDGSLFDVLMYARLDYDSNGREIYPTSAIDVTKRNEIQAELNRTLEFNKTLLRALPTPIFYKDREGRYLGCNQAFEEHTGKTADEIRGKMTFDIWRSDDAQKYHQMDMEIMEHPGYQEYEYQIFNKDGRQRDVVFAKDVFYDDKQHVAGLIGSFLDITDRKRSEARLAESEELYRLLAENTADVIWKMDLEMRFTYVNPSVKMMLGYTQEEFIGAQLANFSDPADFQIMASQARMAINDPQIKQLVFESFIKHKDGHKIPVEITGKALFDDTGKPIAIQGTTRDITERKQAEEEIQNLAKFPSENPHPVMRFDSDGQLVYHNDVSRRMVQDWLDQSRQVKPEIVQQVQNALRQQQIQRYETQLEKRFFALDFTPIVESNCVNVYGLDITDLKLSEKKIQRLNIGLEKRVRRRTLELENTNKELEAFAYSVSHDLRAPLRSIDGFSKILNRKYDAILDEKGKDYLMRICRASNNMSLLIDDMLTLSRITRKEIHMMPVNLSETAEEIAQQLQNNEPDRVIQWAIEPNTIVNADKTLMQSVIQNLLGNAWKFTSHHKTARIEFGLEINSGEMVYYVKDDGAGFDMKYGDKLFGAFQRLHRQDEFKGTGIGLASVQRIIHRHGGRIWAEAEVEKGATFYFTLPQPL